MLKRGAERTAARIALGWLKDLPRRREGVAALEFAIAAPLVILLVLGGIDVARFVLATARVAAVAATVGEMVAVNTSGSVSDTDLQFYRDAGAVIFPQALLDAAQQGVAWTADLGITVSDVAFTNLGALSVPRVVWSGGAAPRSCLVPPLAAADAAPPSRTTLPVDTFGATNLIVVDVTYRFRPTLAGRLLGAMPIARSFYVAPRYVTSLAYSGGAGSFATTC